MSAWYSVKHYLGQKLFDSPWTSWEEVDLFLKAGGPYRVQDLYLFVDKKRDRIFKLIVETLGLLQLPNVISQNCSPTLVGSIRDNNIAFKKRNFTILTNHLNELIDGNKRLEIADEQFLAEYDGIIGWLFVSPVPSQLIRIFKLQENPTTLALLKEEEKFYEETLSGFGLFNNFKPSAIVDNTDIEIEQLRKESMLFKRSAYRQTSWIEALIGWYRKISIEEQKKVAGFIRELKLIPLLISVQALNKLEKRENNASNETFQDFVIAQTLSRIGIYLDESEKAALIAEFKENDRYRRDFSFLEYLLVVLYSPKNDSEKLTEKVSWSVSLRDWVEAVFPLNDNRSAFQRCCELKNNLFADAEGFYQKSKTAHVLQIYLLISSLDYLNEFKISENNKKCLFSYFYFLSEEKLNALVEIICHFEKNKKGASVVLTSSREVADGKHLFALFVWELSLKGVLPAKYLEFTWDGIDVLFQTMNKSNIKTNDPFLNQTLDMINAYSSKMEAYELPDLNLSLKLQNIYKKRENLDSILNDWEPYFAKLQRFQCYVLKEIENALDTPIPQETLLTIMFFCPFILFEKKENDEETNIIKEVRTVSDIRKQLSTNKGYLNPLVVQAAETTRGLFHSNLIISDCDPVLTKHLASICAELYATLLPGLTFFKDICDVLKSSVTEQVFKMEFVDHADDPNLPKKDQINIKWKTTQLLCAWNRKCEEYSRFAVTVARKKQNVQYKLEIEVPLKISYPELNEFVWKLVALQVEALETTECTGDPDSWEEAYQLALEETFSTIKERTSDLLISYSKKKNQTLKWLELTEKDKQPYIKDNIVVAYNENQDLVKYELNSDICKEFYWWNVSIFEFLMTLKTELRKAQWSFFE